MGATDPCSGRSDDVHPTRATPVGHHGTVRILAAPDKFRGTASASEVAAAVAAAGRAHGATVRELPLSDGGEGFLEVFGGPNRSTEVTGPLGTPVEAGWRLDGRTAVIEMARASGLALVGGAEGNDAVAASTAGTGELIAAAVEAGAQRIVVGHGGSATTDGGLAALRSLRPARLRGVELVAAVDVTTRFFDSASTFAPQKGATPNQVLLLERRLSRLAQVYLEDHGIDVTQIPGAGAAGGLAGGLAVVGAEVVPAFEMISDEVELDLAVAETDLVVTGEGLLDDTSFDGKVVGGVVELAADAGTPVLVVVGQILDGALERAIERSDLEPDRVEVVSLIERFGVQRTFDDTTGCITEAVAEHLARA